MKLYLYLVGVIPVIAGCAAPNIETEVSGLVSSIEAADKSASQTVLSGVKAETAAEKRRMIAANEAVYDFPEQCLRLGFDGVSAEEKLALETSDCILQPRFNAPVVRGTAAYTAQGLAALKGYGDTLTTFSGATVGPDSAKNFQSFLTSLNTFAKAIEEDRSQEKPDGIVRTSDIEPLGSLLGAVVEAQRARALRQLVNAAHDDVEVITSELIAYFDQTDGLLDASESLDAKYRAMGAAQDSGNAVQYRRAVVAYETEFEAYQKAVKGSHTGRLLAIWKAQQLLHRQVNGSGDPKALVKLLEDLRALTG